MKKTKKTQASVGSMFGGNQVFSSKPMVIPHPVCSDIILTINPRDNREYQRAVAKIPNSLTPVIMANAIGSKTLTEKAMSAITHSNTKSELATKKAIAKHLFSATHNSAELPYEMRFDLISNVQDESGQSLKVKDSEVDGNPIKFLLDLESAIPKEELDEGDDSFEDEDDDSFEDEDDDSFEDEDGEDSEDKDEESSLIERLTDTGPPEYLAIADYTRRLVVCISILAERNESEKYNTSLKNLTAGQSGSSLTSEKA